MAHIYDYKTKYLLNNWKKLKDGELKALSNNVSWFNICNFEPITIEFIDKFQHRILWMIYSRNRFISEDVIIKYHKLLILPEVIINNNLRENFIMDNISIFIDHIPYLLKTHNFSTDSYNKLKVIYELNK